MTKITFLGTADQIPSALRNHTAILLNYNEENILIDCGEGTQRQFRKAKLNPCKITRILITHWHGDHILGLPGLLLTLSSSGYNKKLCIYGPKHTKTFIKELLKIFKIKIEYNIEVREVSGKFLDTKDFYLEAKSMEHGIPCNAYSFIKKGKIRIDKKKLVKSKLPLGPLLQELKQGKNITYKKKTYLSKNLTFKEKGKKISFVLDTLMNNKIVSFVKDSDLLVCEASFSDKLKVKAKEHLHLTSVQAGEIAKKSKSQKLALTHLGQRYENSPEKILKEAKKVFRNSVVVKDLDVLEV